MNAEIDTDGELGFDDQTIEELDGLPTYLKNLMRAEGFFTKSEVKRAFGIGFFSEASQADRRWKVVGLGRKGIETLKSWANS